MEEDQDAVLNDLLNRIKSLEDRNAQLKESIAEKEKVLSSNSLLNHLLLYMTRKFQKYQIYSMTLKNQFQSSLG